MNRWQKQTMYVMRNDSGVITGISETVPSGYMETPEDWLRKAYRASDEPSKQITEYARRKIAEKKLWMGGD